MTKQKIDPVQGLVDYVLDAKPYHTKIAEVQIGYVYAENVNVTITDKLSWVIDFATNEDIPVAYDCGFGVGPYGGSTPDQTPIATVSVDPVANQFIVLGDQTATFPAGTGIRALGADSHNYGSFTVYTSYVDGPDTVIQVMEMIPDSVASSITSVQLRIVGYDEPSYCDLTSSPSMYVRAYISEALQFQNESGTQGVDIAQEDGVRVANADASITETIQLDWSITQWWQYSVVAFNLADNTIEVAGNALQDIQIGEQINVSGSAGNDGSYRVVPLTDSGLVIYGPEYLSGSNRTRFRVIPTFSSGVAGGIVEPWEYGKTTDHFAIVSIDAAQDIIYVSGNVLDQIQIGEQLNITGSTGNDGLYRVMPFNNGTTVVYGPEYLSGPDQTRFKVLRPATIDFKIESVVTVGLNGTVRIVGDHTSLFGPGASFTIAGSTGNDGAYTVNSSVYGGTYTSIIVNETLTDATPDGVVQVPFVWSGVADGFVEVWEYARDGIFFADAVGTGISETATGTVVETGGSVGAFDYNYWDVVSYDETLGTVIHLYSGTF